MSEAADLSALPLVGYGGRPRIDRNASSREAMRKAGVRKHAECHTLRHCFATQLLQVGRENRTVRELWGHKHVETTMICTDVLNRGGYGVQSPLDRLRRK